MSHNVFANGMEVSCKASSGKTICAFPDVCLSPPTPPAGPIPIPYPNTGMASDTTNGTKTVKIAGQEVGMKNDSYFSKSTGDEPATKTLGMGVVTHQITGQVYFQAYSMNVKVEGAGVPRHLDITTNNHMSKMPGNTPPMPHISSMVPPAFPECEPCKNAAQVGNPVNPITGSKFLADVEDSDFVIDGPLPLGWQRYYNSDNPRVGCFGQGWSIAFETRIVESRAGLSYFDHQGRELRVAPLETGSSMVLPSEQVTLTRRGRDVYEWTLDDGTTYVYAYPVELGDGSRTVRLARIEDRNLNRIEFDRYERGGPTRVRSGTTVLRLEYSANGRLVAVMQLSTTQGAVGPSERVRVAYEYDAKGCLTGVLERGKRPLRSFQWSNGMMVGQMSPLGLWTHYEWNELSPSGKVLRQWTDLGEEWLFDYQSDRTVVKDIEGRTRTYVFGPGGHLIETIDAAGRSNRRVLDRNGLLVAEVRPSGEARRYHRDERGRVTGIDGSAGSRYELVLDDRGQVRSVLAGARARVDYTYDARGNLLSMVSADGTRVEYEYDGRGNVIVARDARGGETRFERDPEGRLIAHSDCSGNTTRFEYDETGQLLTVVDPLAGITRMEYSEFGELLTQVDPNGAVFRWEYDELGRRTTWIDPLERRRRLRYRRDGKTELVEEPDGSITRYGYDRHGRMTTVVNANGAVHTYEWDVLDRLARQVAFDGVETSYTYGPDDLPARIVERTRNGAVRTTQLDFDAFARLRRMQCGATSVEYFYDDLGRLTTASDGRVRVQREYDGQSRILLESTSYFGATHTVRYEYDAIGAIKAIELPDGRKVSHLHYGSGHVHGVLFESEVICDIERDPLHRMVQVTHGSLVARRALDRAGRLAGYRADATGGPVVARSYEYDAADQVLSVADAEGRLAAFRYDPKGQVVAFASRERMQEFTYDSCGNLIDAPGEAAPTNRPDSCGAARYVYDDFGRVLEKRSGSRTLRFRWDDLDRLVELSSHDAGFDQHFTYVYDPFGRRVHKKGDLESSDFCWDDDRLLCIKGTDENCAFTYPDDGFVPIARVDFAGDTTRSVLLHHDQVGTPFAATGPDGSVVWQSTYGYWGDADEVGNPAVAGSPPQRLRFPGQYADAESGLHYNRHRYYDPDCGRYLSPDPIGLLGGLNAYTYGRNTTGWTDPLGLSSTSGGGGCALAGKCAIVIGETQDRVEKYCKAQQGAAAATGHQLYTINSFPGFKWAASATFPGGPKTPDQWDKSLAENKRFVEEAAKKNCTVIDIGRDPAKASAGAPISRYYDLELSMLGMFKNVQRPKASYVDRFTSGPKTTCR